MHWTTVGRSFSIFRTRARRFQFESPTLSPHLPLQATEDLSGTPFLLTKKNQLPSGSLVSEEVQYPWNSPKSLMGWRMPALSLPASLHLLFTMLKLEPISVL